jgi:hypothetical protein
MRFPGGSLIPAAVAAIVARAIGEWHAKELLEKYA